MAGLHIPEARFTLWTLWERRKQLRPEVEASGVYLLAHLPVHDFDRLADSEDARVIYIGESTGGSTGLWWRWEQFNRTAFELPADSFEDKGSHSGAIKYRREFGDSKKASLCVAACVPNIDKPELRTAFIKYLERKLIWEFVVRNQHLPRCNSE